MSTLRAPTLSLVAEIERYLAAVDEFRRQGCQIAWRVHSQPQEARP